RLSPTTRSISSLSLHDALPISLLTCAAAPSSSKASTRTNSLGSSTLRDQSNQRLPGSARVASVNSCTRPNHRSDQSGFVLNLTTDRKSTRLNSSHQIISYAVFC